MAIKVAVIKALGLVVLASSLVFFLLVVFNVPSTARSFRDGTPFTVPCEGREAR